MAVSKQDICTYYGYILSVATKIVKNSESAQDITHDVVERAFRGLQTFRGDHSNLKHWIRSITINASYNFLRANRKHEDIKDYDMPAPEPDVEYEPGLIEKLKIEIERLPPKQRRAVEMKVFGDMTIVEISYVLGTNYDTTKANIRHGLMRVSHRLKLARK